MYQPFYSTYPNTVNETACYKKTANKTTLFFIQIYANTTSEYFIFCAVIDFTFIS